MQLKIEFYSKEEYAIQYESDDQYPFASNYDNDLFVFCGYTVRIIQNFSTHPLGKILSAILYHMSEMDINNIKNHEYEFPDLNSLILVVNLYFPNALNNTLGQVICDEIFTECPHEVEYRGKGNKSFYLSIPPFKFKNNGFGLFGKDINYFGFHSVFCLLNYFSKRNSGQDTFISSLSLVSKAIGTLKILNKIPFADTYEVAKIIVGKVRNKRNENQAINDYSEPIEADQKNAADYYNLGNDWSKRGMYNEAIKDYSKAIELDPKYVDAYLYRGVAYHDLGDYDRAIADYDKAIEINPNFAEGYIRRGDAYQMLEDMNQAIKDYTKAIELDPQCVIAYANRGCGYNYLGEFNQAIMDLTKAIELDPQFAFAYYNRATVYQNLDRLKQAMSDLKMAAKLGHKESQAFLREGGINW